VFPKKSRDVAKKKSKEKSTALETVVDIERPHDDFQETLGIFQKAPLTKLFYAVSLPPITVNKERCPLLSLVFTPSNKRTWFFKRAFNLSWHLIACS
jgi:hypothetical protein